MQGKPDATHRQSRFAVFAMLQLQNPGLTGLISYGKYLSKEFKNSKNDENKKAYNRYIEKELIRNEKNQFGSR